MIKELNHITLAVSNLNKSFEFYRDVLGLKPLCHWHAGAYFLAGNTWVCLSLDPNYQHTDSGYTHYAFGVEQTEFKILTNKIIQSGYKIFKENISEGDSVYFYYPDGHQLEIHVGSWESRIAAKKLNPGSWQNVEFFVEIE